MDFNNISNKIENNPPLEFGGIFSRSIELFKKVWVQGFITLLLTFICIIPFYILFFVPLIAAGITDPEMISQEELPTGVIAAMALIVPILVLGVMTVSLALMAAFLRICKLKDTNAQDSDDYFHYFKNGRMRKLLFLSLIFLGITLLGMITCGIGLIYIVVPLSLIPVFLAFNEDLSAVEIVNASFRLGNKNWLVIFGLLIVMGLVAELGVILCFVGIFFTAMLAKIPVYFMYKDGVGFSENDDLSMHN